MMEELVPLELLVNKPIAEEIRKNGLAEIALRRADAKFKAMIKCRLLDDSLSDSELMQKILSSSMNMSISGSCSMESVRCSMHTFGHTVGNNLPVLSEPMKTMVSHVDSIYTITNALLKISYINTAISLVNLVVDVIGFVIVNKKLNKLNSEVKSMADNISAIHKIEINKKITTCQSIIMDFITMNEKIQDSEQISIYEMDGLLSKMMTFISDIIRNFNVDALPIDLVLKIVYTLLPAYTLLLNEYITRYYYEKHKEPPKYDIFLSLYNELDDITIRQSIQNYYFIDQKKHLQEVVDLLNVHTLIVFNGQVQIEDQFTILEKLETKEKVETFDLELENSVKHWFRKQNEKIAEKCGISNTKCKKVLREIGLY